MKTKIKWSDIKRLAKLANLEIKKLDMESEYYDYFEIEFEWAGNVCRINADIFLEDAYDKLYRKGDFADFRLVVGPNRSFDIDQAARRSVGILATIISDGAW